MTTSDHERLHRDLGVYVLGALEPLERDRLERHLATCDACRDDLADLAVLPALLARLPEDEVADPPPVGPVLERIAGERRRARRRGRLLAVTAAAASLLAVAAVVLALAVPAGPTGARWAATGQAVTATVEARGWGMAVTIRTADLPARAGYTAVAVRGDGHRAQIASWTAVDGPVEVTGACYLDAAEVTRIEILAARSDEVVSVLEPG